MRLLLQNLVVADATAPARKNPIFPSHPRATKVNTRIVPRLVNRPRAASTENPCVNSVRMVRWALDDGRRWGGSMFYQQVEKLFNTRVHQPCMNNTFARTHHASSARRRFLAESSRLGDPPVYCARLRSTRSSSGECTDSPQHRQRG